MELNTNIDFIKCKAERVCNQCFDLINPLMPPIPVNPKAFLWVLGRWILWSFWKFLWLIYLVMCRFTTSSLSQLKHCLCGDINCRRCRLAPSLLLPTMSWGSWWVKNSCLQQLEGGGKKDSLLLALWTWSVIVCLSFFICNLWTITASPRATINSKLNSTHKWVLN